MKSYLSFFKNGRFQAALVSAGATALFITAAASAATTISTNIVTAGNLTVTGTSGLTGLTTMVYASTTGISLTRNLLVNGYATTTGATGNIETAGTLTVIGTSNFTGLTTMVYASSTSFSTSVASTTNLTLGAGSTLAGMIFGFCTIADISVSTASSTKQATCASATGVTTDYRVFVQATSSLPAGIVIASATSSAGAIEVRLHNPPGGPGTPAAAAVSLNFWAVR